MAGLVRFVPNPVGIEALKRSVGVQVVLTALGTALKAAAQSHAPVQTGKYRDSIEVEDGDLPGTKRVVAHDFKANWIEFGTVDTPAFAPLRTAADSLGLRLRGGKGGA
ncbi:MAG: HK97 gp10 family phage protein [Actinomycetota bacterium]